LTSTDSKKLAAPPSSNQHATWRVSDATMIAMSRNAPSTLAILSSVGVLDRQPTKGSTRSR
jgi:hypothetical protein